MPELNQDYYVKTVAECFEVLMTGRDGVFFGASHIGLQSTHACGRQLRRAQILLFARWKRFVPIQDRSTGRHYQSNCSSCFGRRIRGSRRKRRTGKMSVDVWTPITLILWTVGVRCQDGRFNGREPCRRPRQNTLLWLRS